MGRLQFLMGVFSDRCTVLLLLIRPSPPSWVCMRSTINPWPSLARYCNTVTVYELFLKTYCRLDLQVEVRPMMIIALTYDHRLIDGREAVLCLRKIKQSVEDPATMLLEL